MKLKNKNFNLITIEVTKKELEDVGFDKIWDEIRETYSAQDYEMEKFTESQDKNLFFINLKYKKDLKVIGF